MRVTEGTLVRVRWTRSGYAPVDKQGSCKEELLIQKTECKRSFFRDQFQVVDKVTRKTLNVHPKFIGEHWVDNQKNPSIVFFREDDLNSVPCCVELQTYESFSGTLDLTQPNEKGEFVIELQPEQHIYKCCIDTNIPDARTVEFEIKTQHRLNGSEIPGFQFDGTPSETRVNRLKCSVMPSVGRTATSISCENYTSREDGNDYTAKERNKKGSHRLKYILVGGLITVIVVAYCVVHWIASSSDKPQNTEVVSDACSDSASDWNKAVEYLRQNNTKWIESDMENYSALKGVYAMIKNFEFKRLKSFIDNHSDLKDINEWGRLYKIAEENNDKKGVCPTDECIDVESYLETDWGAKEDAKDPDSSSDSSNGVSVPQSTTASEDCGGNGHTDDKGAHPDKEKTNEKGGSADKDDSNGSNNQDSNT